MRAALSWPGYQVHAIPTAATRPVARSLPSAPVMSASPAPPGAGYFRPGRMVRVDHIEVQVHVQRAVRQPGGGDGRHLDLTDGRAGQVSGLRRIQVAGAD